MSQSWQAERLPQAALEANFAEVVPPFSRDEATVEASRCLFCYDAPCIRACPTSIDIPSFIRKITTENVPGSARVILESNPLGATCARVCPVSQLCEGACVLGAQHRPIQIGRLQRYSTDFILSREIRVLHKPATSSGRKVACVGGGPASMSAAMRLARKGHAVTVFESKPEPGGLDTFGIVSFRLPAQVSLSEVGWARDLGVEFLTGVQVGRDISMEQLLKQFDALFVGVGLGGVPRLGIPGEELPGVLDALTFIEETKVRPLAELAIGRRVAVIGAGNTAIDAATASQRLGADEVSIVYRRSVEQMPAYRFEYDFAKQEGVVFRWLTRPVAVTGNARVEGLRCVRTRLGAPGPDGRRGPEDVPGSEFVLEVDTVIRAIGQKSLAGFLAPLGLLDGKGKIAADPATGRTRHPKIFSAGDCVEAGGGDEATVVAVVAAGKRAADSIDHDLQQQGTSRPVADGASAGR